MTPWFARRRGAGERWLWVLVFVATGAACGGPGATGSATTADGTPTTVPQTSGPSLDAQTVQPMPADPPLAMLSGSWDAPVAGAPGTFSWGGLVSDAPWIVAAPTGDVASGPMTVAFVPGLAQTTWLARWAPVVDGAAADAVPGSEGGTGAIVIAPPGDAGDWSLQLTATFAAGHDATWYWRLEIVR